MISQICGMREPACFGEVRRRSDQDVPVSHEPSKHKTALGLPADPKRHIYLIVHQIQVLIGYENFRGNLRMKPKKTVDQWDEEEVGKARWCSQPKRSRYDILTFLQFGPGAIKTIQNLLAMRQTFASALSWL
jgi:hypothetical protein